MLLDGEAYHKNHKNGRPSQGSPYIQCNPSLDLIRLLMKGAKLIFKVHFEEKNAWEWARHFWQMDNM